MMNKNFVLSKLGEVRKNAFVAEFELGLSTHGLVLSGNAKIDTGCERTSIALQSPSVGIDKRTALVYKKHFEYHCGTSLTDDAANDIAEGDYIFIGCLRNNVTKEYLDAVEK